MPSYLETSMEIAREAGAVLSRYFAERVTYQLKGEFDLVTDADRASERLVVDRLRAHFPTHAIVAEEGGGNDGSSEYRWYVDPLDGTTNFYHGFPMFNVTLALERSGELVAGCIYDPVRDEMFAAERGGGAWLNGGRIHVSQAARLEECLVATGFPSRKRHRNVNIHFFYQMSMWTHGARRAGSAALDLAYTACGRLDVYWEFGLKPWDMAAGMLLVSEAGGKVSDMHGEPAQVGGPHLLTDNGLVHGQVLELFGEVFQGRYRTPLPLVEVAP
jgi:myo-inositol-1(or 4)-monophosphatase